jgi:zinc protease
VASKASPSVESFAPKQTKPIKLPDWAEKALNRLSIPPSIVNPTVTILPNGLKLIVQSAAVSDTISVYGHVKNNPDLEEPVGKEGVGDVLDQLFSYGTASLDRVAFQKALDDIGARESAGTDFEVQVLSAHFDRGVQLLADNVLHPVFPEEAFQVVRKQVGAIAAGKLQSPDDLANQALKTSLYPKGDPTARQATPTSVSSLTLEDVKSYHGKVFRPDLTTIVVIGNVTPEQAKKTIEKHFGAWKASGPKPETDLPLVPPNQASLTTIPDKSRVQDRVTLAETLGLNRSHPDYYALELGNHILGGAFYATRLYRDLRESADLVYYVSSSFDVGKTRSLYQVEYACDPANVSKARRIVENNLRELQTRLVGAEELRQEKHSCCVKCLCPNQALSLLPAGSSTELPMAFPLMSRPWRPSGILN